MSDWVEASTIFLTLAGSRLYGTSTPASDVDRRGVCVPPPEVALGFARPFEQHQVPGEDTVIFSLRKFMELAAACNPNFIELLFAPDDAALVRRPTWERLVRRRDEFLSAAAFQTFTGYAASQLARLRSHRAWLLDPPARRPTRAEFGLGEAGAGARVLARDADEGAVDPEAAEVVARERRYKEAARRWQQFEAWQRGRNPARAALEARSGYDTKHAMHLVRLLRMGHELLTRGVVLVRRPDADELRAIRDGAWSYDQAMAHVDALQAELAAVHAERRYVVPERVDRDALSDLCAELHLQHWHEARLTPRA